MAELGHTDPAPAVSIYAHAMRRDDQEYERLCALGRMGTSPPSLPTPDGPHALQGTPRTRKPAQRAGFPERGRQDLNLRLLPPENSRRNALRNAQSALQSQIRAHRGRTGSPASRPDSAQFGGVWAPVPKRFGSGRPVSASARNQCEGTAVVPTWFPVRGRVCWRRPAAAQHRKHSHTLLTASRVPPSTRSPRDAPVEAAWVSWVHRATAKA
jgi:hypothetical protein